MRGKTPPNFVKPNCIMQLADSVSVAKIKIIYASRQRAHSEPSHSYDAAVHLTGDNDNARSRWTNDMPVLDGVKPRPLHYPFAEQANLVLKRKKRIYCWTRSQTNLNIGESNDQVRVQIPTSPRQVRDDRKNVSSPRPDSSTTALNREGGKRRVIKQATARDSFIIII